MNIEHRLKIKKDKYGIKGKVLSSYSDCNLGLKNQNSYKIRYLHTFLTLRVVIALTNTHYLCYLHAVD